MEAEVGDRISWSEDSQQQRGTVRKVVQAGWRTLVYVEGSKFPLDPKEVQQLSRTVGKKAVN